MMAQVMPVEERQTHRRLRAPREDGQALILPPLDAVGEVVSGNERLRRSGDWADYDVHGRRLVELSDTARADLLQQALAYTRSYRDVDVPETGRILLAGHQPQLFHPGVWFKNFALSRIAADHHAVGINLLIDNDTVKSTAARVPGGPADSPQLRTIPYDAPAPAVPHEERRILDPETLRGFGPRAAEHLRPLVPESLLEDYWPRVLDRAAENDNLGQCLAQARHQLEGDLGGATLEVPNSRVCESEAFCWFVAHLLAHLPRLWDVHNASLAEFRQSHRLRSASHPVPDLAADGPWLEAPFWLWSRDDPRRRAVFARQSGDTVLLSDRAGCEVALPLTPEGDAAAAVEILAGLPDRGIKLRTRALTNTLWARLALGDLFLHGIGGAKYDELTDLLIGRFFGLQPPGFLTISATLLLPVDRPNVSEEDLRRIDRQLRELTFQPERHLKHGLGENEPNHQPPAELIAEKQRWIDAVPTPSDARRRFLAIRRVNELLQPSVAPLRDQLHRERSDLTHELRSRAILASREYAFCLFPAKKMRIFMLELLSDSS